MIDDETMGRFFVECQRLLDAHLISFEAIARLRNALYGPSVAPLDAHTYRDALLWRKRSEEANS